MKILIVDTETTGLTAEHSIIEIGGIVMVENEIKEEFSLRGKPARFDNIEQKALDIQGITLEELENYPDRQEMHDCFMGILDKYINRYDSKDFFTAIGQNIRFDVDGLFRLHSEFAEPGKERYFWGYLKPSHVDILNLVKFLQVIKVMEPTSNIQLETVANYFGYEFRAHSALEDCRAVLQIIKGLKDLIFKATK